MLFIITYVLVLFLLGWMGLFLIRQHVILILIAMELILLAINLLFVIYSIYYNDIFGQILSFFMLIVAAAESALGLAIVVIYYRVKGGIAVSLLTLLKS